ncbi:AAA domain containing protein [Novymonas esmeraldas]|uniref:AAA domain containing protein n=1 Tax=Novymonas esmeraldas TaxID=1808958 RepID=A0AAW0F128_9TRYP
MPLAADWTEEKNACVDWADPVEVLCNGFTFLQIVAAHPRLRDYYDVADQQAERSAAKDVFLIGSDEAKVTWLTRWRAQGLLLPRSERWCRFCGGGGHTRLRCPHRLRGETSGDADSAGEGPPSASPSADPPRPSVLAKYREHLQRVELRRILEEKQKPRAELTSVRRGGAAAARAGQAAAAPALFAVEERRRGVVCRLDEANNIGFAAVAGMGELKFFVDRVDVGVKTVAVGDAVTFKLDASRDYPIAADVRHERPVITLEDVRKFLHRCRAARHPIKVMSTLLMHAHEWHVLLRWLQVLREQDAALYVEAAHTLVELTTFVGNREPIHVPVLGAFLALLRTAPPIAPAVTPPTTTAPGGVAATTTTPPPPPAVPPFYPDMMGEALRLHSTTAVAGATTSAEARLSEDRWLEVAQLVTLVRCYCPPSCTGDAGHGGEAAVVAQLQSFFAERLTHATGPAARRLQLVQARLAQQTSAADVAAPAVPGRGSSGLALIPTAAELAVPPPNPTSVFAAVNLPVNGAATYEDTDDFIRDQCRLLRADTFEAVSRSLPALCYSLPDYTPTSETLSDMQHARVYSGVRCLGKVLTGDRDYSHPESYLLEVHPHSSKADLRAQLHEGTTVCISTALDPSAMADGEIFWGVVSSCDSTFIAAGVIAVAACAGSASFELMRAALDRNAAAGRPDRSFLLETPIFMAGYESIMRALEAFCGPLAMPLPLVRQLVGPQAAAASAAAGADAATGGASGAVTAATAAGSGSSSSSDDGDALMDYIPPHCAGAFRELTDDIRSQFALDEGQEAVMRQLPVAKMILVQGPPGTGKSFIGCRVVEAYVRYKQLVASGDILQKVSIDMLRSTRLEDLLPRVGPMVVITYKNHALDEFLLDLLDCGLWESSRPRVGQQLAAGISGAAATSLPSGAGTFPGGKRLVRIGGRSRESRLDGYNLGSLLHGSVDRAAINSLKDRLFVLNQRLERLTKEIHYLESGRVPRVYFERWLTAEQRRHTTYDDREAWLAGERYIGPLVETADVVPPTHYQTLLQTRMATVLSEARGQQTATTATATTATTATTAEAAEVAKAEADAEDVSLSVFQEMRREEERREFNDRLHQTYISSEALLLASQPPPRPAAVPEELLSLWSLSPRLRHEYYAFLIENTIAAKARDCLTIMETMKSVVRVRRHAMDELKLSLLQGADVVGLTTTGCAMNQNLLRSLRPSVLVVEEAAEVLESQLLACMTDSLKQIILIGDHYQLQPKVDTFQYEKINHLNLSLFERLARTTQPIRLTEQRRMHPDISRLIRPFYAPEPLVDHPLLLTRAFPCASESAVVDRVPGLAQRVFFWRHRHPEEEAPGSRSKVNTREIRMVQQVVAHLVSQGVLQKSITVVTPYLGQCRMLRGVLRLRSLADVRVSTVDLYQGDENDIIVLSLVRTEKLTDFIRTRNRLIVSCSRARFAMVVVGNDTLLRQCHHWELVLDQLQAERCIGDSLPITYRDRPSAVEQMTVTGVVSAAALEAELATQQRHRHTTRPRPLSVAESAVDAMEGAAQHTEAGDGAQDSDGGADGGADGADGGAGGESGAEEDE